MCCHLPLYLHSMAVRVVFLGSKPIGFKCLQYLLQNKQTLEVEVVAMRTQARKEFSGDYDLTALAAAHNIPLLSSLDNLPECDIIYSVQHHELLKQPHIDKAKTIAVNLHMAPLPEYRGCNQFSFAIMDNAQEFGVTLHEIDTRIDHGAVLFERRFAIPKDCWVSDLYTLTEAEALQLFKESMQPLLAGDYKKVTQQELMLQRSSSIHYRNEINTLKQLDLNQSQEEIARRIRATYMPGFEPPYFMIAGKKIYAQIAEE